jgi:uncharacterized RDD family membrane protein YckC
MPSLVWGVAAFVTFLLVPFDLLGADHFGIAQRLFLAVWLSWPIGLTVHLRRCERAAVAPVQPAGAVVG